MRMETRMRTQIRTSGTLGWSVQETPGQGTLEWCQNQGSDNTLGGVKEFGLVAMVSRVGGSERHSSLIGKRNITLGPKLGTCKKGGGWQVMDMLGLNQDRIGSDDIISCDPCKGMAGENTDVVIIVGTSEPKQEVVSPIDQ